VALHCPSCQAEYTPGARFCSACGARLDAPAEVEERRLVTILFADIAGSTALGERLDPEDVRQIQRSLYELVVAELDRHGGVAEKFIGDAVVAVFGVPRAHEDDAERAVRAGLQIMAAFEGLAASARERYGIDIALRVGIDAGEVVSGRDAVARGELMVSGDAVNAAARLQQNAAPGEVLCGDRVVQATVHAITYGPAREVAARGKSVVLAARPAIAAGPTVAGRPRRSEQTPLVGREGELDLLTTVAARALDERIPQLVTLYGPAGIGKSRLLAEIAASRPDAALVTGPCLPYGEGITWWPLAVIARHLAGIRESDSAERSRELLDRSLADLVDAEAADAIAYTIGLEGASSPTAALPTSAVPRAMRTAWTRLVTALGRRAPCILAIEDIHWAADALLDLLDHLAGSLEDCGVLIVCPARHELLERRPTWGAGLRNHTAIDLRPLAPDAAAKLLDALLADAEAADRRRILERAGGNPFYTEEIVRMLRDRGEHEAVIPDTVRAVIAARIDLLGEEERGTLLACSVVGATFWGEAVGADPDVLDALVRRDLIREDAETSFTGLAEYAFRHALTREVAYSALSRTARRELHLRVADFIERRSAGREREFRDLLAHHYEQAIRAGEDRPEVRARAAEHLLAAGTGALRRGANLSARRMLEFAYNLGEPWRTQAGLAMAETLVYLDQLDDAERVLTSLVATFREQGEREPAADALGWLSRVHWRAGRRAAAVAAAEEAVELLKGMPESPAMAHAKARRAQLAGLGAEPAQRALSLEALELARRVGDPFSIASSLANLAIAEGNETATASFELADETQRIALEAGAIEEAARAAVNYLWNASDSAPLDDLDRAWRVLFGRVERFEGVAFMYGYGVISHALFVLYPQGRLDEVDAALRDRQFRSLASVGNLFPWIELDARVAALRGDLLAARTAMGSSLEMADAVGETQRISRMRGLAALLASLEGDAAAARRHVGVALESQRGRVCAGLRIDLTAAAAAAFGRLGDEDALQWISAELDPHLAPLGVSGAIAARRSLRGALRAVQGDNSGAAEDFAEVRQLYEDRQAWLPAAAAGLALAAALDAAGDAEAGRIARARSDAVLDPLGVVYLI
jgi:class 3 adenylate cyclase